MSQSPYQPPTSFQQPMNFDYFQDPLGPAKRAGALQYVVGGIVVLSSFCCGGVGVLLPRMMAERPEVFTEMQQIGSGMKFVQVSLFILAGVVFLMGVGLLVLAGFVRRGSKGAIITSLVIASLAIIGLLINTLGSASRLVSAPGPEAGLGICILVVPLLLFVLLIVWLVQGMRSADRAMAQGYAMQYWQYAQQQQAYAQMMQQQQQPPPAGSQEPPPPPPQ